MRCRGSQMTGKLRFSIAVLLVIVPAAEGQDRNLPVFQSVPELAYRLFPIFFNRRQDLVSGKLQR
jgi:hypothetical protein